MRNLLLISVVTAMASLALAQSTTKPTPVVTSVEEKVLQLTRDWLAAEERGDRARLQQIIADDFQGTGPMGNTVFKRDVIPEEGSESGLAITASDLKVRIFGDTAIVTAGGVQKFEEKRELRFTVVFAKRNDRWQMVAGHLSAVPKV